MLYTKLQPLSPFDQHIMSDLDFRVLGPLDYDIESQTKVSGLLDPPVIIFMASDFRVRVFQDYGLPSSSTYKIEVFSLFYMSRRQKKKTDPEVTSFTTGRSDYFCQKMSQMTKFMIREILCGNVSVSLFYKMVERHIGNWVSLILDFDW